MEWLSSIFTSLKAWFNDAGWLSNALTIGGSSLGLAAFGQKLYRQLFGLSTFRDLIRAHVFPTWTPASFKSLTEIAIVDDNPADFPIAELKKAGYHVTTYRHVSLTDLDGLATYDVVFLDIHGIVKDDVEEGGLNVLAKLRAVNPRQKICAVSGKRFDPLASTFFKQADDVQRKPMTAQKCQEIIDVLAKEKLDPEHLAHALDEATATLSSNTRRKLVNEIATFIEARNAGKEFKPSAKIAFLIGHKFDLLIKDLVRVLQNGHT